MQSRFGLLWPVLASLVLPLIAAWFAYPATHLPPGFGVFPPQFVQDPPPFNLLVFCVILLVELAIAAFLLFPAWFGFKPVPPAPPFPRAKLPVWFWIGAVLTLFFWWLMWTRPTTPPLGPLVPYAFTPMWGGFILVLDGLVYYRSGGRSLLASKPKMLLMSALVSVPGWYFFEYFDYFVLSNWYYPNAGILPHATIVVLFLLAYTTVWPAIFEWYTLLNTFPRFAVRYSNGPKISLSGNLLLWGGLLLIVLTVFLPYPLFWAMWIAPLIVISGHLIRKNVWTPFTAMAQGNWSPLLLIALSSLCNGFFWEMWNYGSAHPDPGLQTNPNYWIYDVPYVNVIHIFAEMPLLGYFGYLPFGILVWIVFIWAGKLFGFDPILGGTNNAPPN
ncbi:MAG: mechanosensitive ion channel protein MscS [Sideroxydans sp.]|nr:mechanosensitive ion channel protein MscS [Sideroxydans sp.]